MVGGRGCGPSRHPTMCQRRDGGEVDRTGVFVGTGGGRGDLKVKSNGVWVGGGRRMEKRKRRRVEKGQR